MIFLVDLLILLFWKASWFHQEQIQDQFIPIESLERKEIKSKIEVLFYSGNKEMVDAFALALGNQVMGMMPLQYY